MTDENKNRPQGNNWKIVDGDSVYLKVINFPVPEDLQIGGESMWVLQVNGTDNEGTGTLNNIPAFCKEVSFGDTIQYAGGTEELKPHFTKKVGD